MLPSTSWSSWAPRAAGLGKKRDDAYESPGVEMTDLSTKVGKDAGKKKKWKFISTQQKIYKEAIKKLKEEGWHDPNAHVDWDEGPCRFVKCPHCGFTPPQSEPSQA